MLNKMVRATREITSLNPCACSVQAGEIGKVIVCLENEKGFSMLVKFDEHENARSVVHFKTDKLNRNKLEVYQS